MNKFEAGYKLLDLTEENRRKLAGLATITVATKTVSRTIVIETVVISSGQRQVTHRESAVAKLVRTTD
jgi:hypothetical protein